VLGIVASIDSMPVVQARMVDEGACRRRGEATFDVV